MAFIGYLTLFILAVMAGYFCTKIASFTVGKYFKKDIQILDMAVGIGAAIPILLISFVMALFNPSACAFLFIYLTSILTCLMIIGFFQKPVKMQVWGLILLCFTGTFFLPCSVLVAGWFGLGMQLIITIFWMAFLYAFVQLDRVPFLTPMLSIGYMFTVWLLAIYNFIEGPVAAIGLVLLAFSMGIVLMLKRIIFPRLGVHASLLMGFLWGFFAAYIMALGYAQTAFYMGGYLLLELGYIIISTIVLTKTFFPLRGPFLIERAVMTKVNPTKALTSVMWLNVMLCLLGVTFVSKFYSGAAESAWILWAVILGYIAYRLLNWDKKQTKLRDLFTDAKQGVNTLVQQAKKTGEMISKKEQKVEKPTALGTSPKVVSPKHTAQKVAAKKRPTENITKTAARKRVQKTTGGIKTGRTKGAKGK